MIGQSFAIVAVILVMSFMFLRTGRRAGALFALPLVSVSAFHLLGYAVYKMLVQSELPTQSLHVALDVAGLIVGLTLCWILARAINVKKLRYVYFISCAVFLTALTMVYINVLT